MLINPHYCDWYWSCKWYCPCCGRSKPRPVVIEREVIKEVVRYVPAKRWR